MKNDELKDHIAAESEAVADEGLADEGLADGAGADGETSDPEAQLEALTEKLAEAEAGLAEAEKMAAEYLDGWKRAQASFANFRKRTEAEQAQWRSAANAQLLSRLLPVLDDFKRAFDAIPEEERDSSWLSGIRLVQRKVAAIVESENVAPITVEPHDTFDPNFHEAVLYQEVPGFSEGEVVAEVETGYMLGNRVLRPTVVVVAKGEPKTTASPAAEDASGVEAEDAPASSENDERAEAA